MTELILLGSKITADGDCRPEVKRCLLLGKKGHDKSRQPTKKQRCHFVDKGSYTLFSSVQSLIHAWPVTPWAAARQASLSITNSQSLLKLMSFESVMLSSHLILCHPNLLLPSIFPSSRVFSNESVLCQSIGGSPSASVLPMNIQDWFLLGWTGWISLQSKGLSRVFTNTAVQKHQFFSS